MKAIQIYLLSLLSGLLLAFSWFPYGFTFLIFAAFVPLLIAEQAVYKEPRSFSSLTLFLAAYLSFFIWNVLTTWWIKNASWSGAVMAIGCNSLLMAGVFWLFHISKKLLGEKYGLLIFICFWLTFEFLHFDWDLTYPWLTLGNVFASANYMVQWYEYTGVFGGSLWVLVVNAFISEKVKGQKQKKNNASGEGIPFKNKKTLMVDLALLTFLILLPLTISFILSNKPYNFTDKVNVVVVQPNIDPYHDKFNGDGIEHLQKMLALAEEKINATTDYLLFPETAITEQLWENNISESKSIRLLQTFLKTHPHLKIIIGAATYKAYGHHEEPSATARKFIGGEEYYDAYNTAFQIDSTARIQIYHKSKLVPGVEKMPFPFIFKYLENFALDLGGTSGSLGIQNERTTFVSADSKMQTAPVICYESIYGEFVSTYVNNGAQFISIITNDGWWGDTPGYQQHLQYGALRAIETRRWIARSANTGISCFINPKGQILQATGWWQPAVIAQSIGIDNSKTFYTTYGDYIARAAFYASLCMLIYALLIRVKVLKK